jgi:DNA sulfur modification protein DndE
MIDRVRLTAVAKNQISTMKRKTGIEHNNSICRYALCLSLSNDSRPPEEEFNFNGGLEIDWKTLTGGNEFLYLNLLLIRAARDGDGLDSESIRHLCVSHVHRGLSYLASDEEALLSLAKVV